MPMSPFTPTDEFTEPVMCETNGTVITREGLGDLGLQRLTNQCTFLKNRLPGADAAIPIVVAPLARDLDVGGEWDVAVGGVLLQVTAGGETVTLPWTGPPAGTLTRIDALVYGDYSSGGHAGMPAGMPGIHVYALDPVTGGLDDLGSVADPSASLGAYETAHQISATGLSVDLSERLIHVVVTGESGANALADSFAVLGLRFHVTP